MLEFICNSCQGYADRPVSHCPHCQTPLILAGPEKNITDSIKPDCLVHRYQGSDLLEPALVLKEGKINMKVAVKLKDLAKPLTVPKAEVFRNNDAVFQAITALRRQRKEQMEEFDKAIAAYWKKLQNYAPL